MLKVWGRMQIIRDSVELPGCTLRELQKFRRNSDNDQRILQEF